ncbi:MAG TPA: DEAD/DEAH box helicase [Polyangiales bacterium]|nr:DEAD/DEAH box helicase [Polyangiales bacterium]
MKFSELGLSQPLLRALDAAGYQSPTPIQAQAIPHVLSGRDLFGCAQTGTGKTAAFALPIVDRLISAPAPNGRPKTRVLVLSPTRELAAQIGESFETYGRHTSLRYAVVFGGVSMQRQIQALARGVDVVVATPGRLLDLMKQRAISLADVQVLVLDEADRMLDMGFVNDVMRIASAVPKARQTLLFSATLPESIRSLAQSLLSSPVHVAVDAVSSAAETLDQSVYFVDKADKRALLAWVLQDLKIDRTLAFTRTKHGADRVVEFLQKRGVPAAALHGNKSQNARERALDSFKSGKLRVLVATDIAARGIDIDQLSHVINFEVPNTPESYVHRIGRSGRAGTSGVALSFCDAEERPYLRSIERLIRMPIRVVQDHPHPPQQRSEAPQAPNNDRGPRHDRGRRGGHQQSGRRSEQRPPQRRADDKISLPAFDANASQPQAAKPRAVKPGFSPRRRSGRY